MYVKLLFTYVLQKSNSLTFHETYQGTNRPKGNRLSRDSQNERLPEAEGGSTYLAGARPRVKARDKFSLVNTWTSLDRPRLQERKILPGKGELAGKMESRKVRSPRPACHS